MVVTGVVEVAFLETRDEVTALLGSGDEVTRADDVTAFVTIDALLTTESVASRLAGEEAGTELGMIELVNVWAAALTIEEVSVKGVTVAEETASWAIPVVVIF